MISDVRELFDIFFFYITLVCIFYSNNEASKLSLRMSIYLSVKKTKETLRD